MPLSICHAVLLVSLASLWHSDNLPQTWFQSDPYRLIGNLHFVELWLLRGLRYVHIGLLREIV